MLILSTVGSFAISRLGDIIYDLVIAPKVGSVLLEEYIDFPVGGIDDDAAWTGFMWNRFADWVVNGTPDVPPNFSTNTVSMDLRRKLQEQLKQKLSSKRKFAQAIRSALTKYGAFPLTVGTQSKGLFRVEEVSYPTSRAAFISMNAPNPDEDRALLQSIASALVSEYAMDNMDKNDGTVDVAALETALYNRIESFLQRDEKEKIDSFEHETPVPSSVEVARGVAPHEYFGSSITVADFSGRNNGQK